ncbi:molybdopterin-binding protein [Nonomuraea sp. NPDC046802]|uniref:molybdopterin-binding protein n=1 Tax=Nonomuraea sp. NPDC046802 TaxID=3154919 RepID=UPI003403EB1C
MTVVGHDRLVEAMSWAAARALAAGAACSLKPVSTPLREALGCRLAAPLTALVPVPGVDVSAMDGYAVAGEGPWRVVGRVLAGGAPHEAALLGGETVEIATGAPVPAGAEAVLPWEHATVTHGTPQGEGATAVPRWVHGLIEVGKHIRRRGEDIAEGAVVLGAGAVVTPVVLGLAAGLGHDTLLVRPRPRVAVLVTGDEVVHEGLPEPGRVRDAIGPFLPGLVEWAGGHVTTTLRLPDGPHPLTEALTASPATPTTVSPATPATASPATPTTASPATPTTASPVTPVTASPVTPVAVSPVTPATVSPPTPVRARSVSPVTAPPATAVTGSPAGSSGAPGGGELGAGVPGGGGVSCGGVPAASEGGGVPSGGGVPAASEGGLGEVVAAADVVVVCGASSKGPADHLRAVLAHIGAEVLIDGVAVRPGHPQLLARLPDGRLLVGLPGNPFAALAAALTLLAPVLRELAGTAAAKETSALAGAVRAHPRDTRLVPVRRTGEGAVPVGHDRPGSLWGAALADALAVVPPGWAGEQVELIELP